MMFADSDSPSRLIMLDELNVGQAHDLLGNLPADDLDILGHTLGMALLQHICDYLICSWDDLTGPWENARNWFYDTPDGKAFTICCRLQRRVAHRNGAR